MIEIPTSEKEAEQKMKRLEKLLEDEIAEMAKYVKLKLSFGVDIFNIQLPDSTIELKKIIFYILNKLQRTHIDNLILRQYLISFPEFIDTLKLREQISDPKELLLKICQNLKKEEIFQDRVIFYNGQYGKSFYLILEGEVSVLLPYEFKLKLTDKQVIKYMYYLLQLKEYELIRLILENNRHVFNDLDYRENTLYNKLKAYSERGIPINTETEKISACEYMQRFEYFAHLEKRQREEASKSDEKEKIEIKKKEQLKVRKSYFDILLRENLKKRAYIEKRHDFKCIENDEDDEEIIKNKNFFYETQETFSIYKYYEVIRLGKGKCFGELALTKEGKRRNATIITTKGSIFGILQKEAYQAFVKETMDKARKLNVELLLKSRLFRGCNSEKFENHLFNFFKLMKKNKGEYLFKQGERRDYIYFLKKGEIQLEFFCNYFYLETILNNLGYSDENLDIKDLIKSKKIEHFCKINRKFKVLIISDEVIGLEDHTLAPEHIYYSLSGLCASYCEMFALDVKFLSRIMSEKIIRNNYAHLVKERKLRLAERIILLKNNVIMQQINFLKENIKDNNEKISEHQNAFNNSHNLKSNKNFERHDFIKPKSTFKDRKLKTNKITLESEKKSENLKNNMPTSIYSYGQKNDMKRKEEKSNSTNKNKLNIYQISELTSSIDLNRFRVFESPKRKFKLKESKININNEESIINKIKKNNHSNKFASTFSNGFKPKSNAFPSLVQNLKSQKNKNSLNRISLKTESLMTNEDYSEDKSKKRKSKNIKYVNFRDIKIPKILLRQSNIFNAEIDKINEIIINNYDKVTPSTYKKPIKKIQNLAISVPDFNSEESQRKIYANSLSVDSKRKFFPLSTVKKKDNNNNYKSIDENDIINYFEKN